MNEKFSILHSASLRAVLKISRSLYSKRVRVFENKTLTTDSNPVIKGTLFWYDSGIGIQGTDGIRVLLGPTRFSE